MFCSLVIFLVCVSLCVTPSTDLQSSAFVCSHFNLTTLLFGGNKRSPCKQLDHHSSSTKLSWLLNMPSFKQLLDVLHRSLITFYGTFTKSSQGELIHVLNNRRPSYSDMLSSLWLLFLLTRNKQLLMSETLNRMHEIKFQINYHHVPVLKMLIIQPGALRSAYKAFPDGLCSALLCGKSMFEGNCVTLHRADRIRHKIRCRHSIETMVNFLMK